MLKCVIITLERWDEASPCKFKLQCQNLWCYMLTKKLWRDCSHITISWGEQDQLLSSTENVWENQEDQLALAPVAVTGQDWPEFQLSRGCVCVLVSQSCQGLYGLMVWGQPGSSAHGILHARKQVGYLLLLQVVSLTLGFNGASYVSWEKAVAPHSSTLAWKIPWTVEPGRLQSMG